MRIARYISAARESSGSISNHSNITEQLPCFGSLIGMYLLMALITVLYYNYGDGSGLCTFTFIFASGSEHIMSGALGNQFRKF